MSYLIYSACIQYITTSSDHSGTELRDRGIQPRDGKSLDKTVPQVQLPRGPASFASNLGRANTDLIAYAI
jgi:hypothetical protein